MTGPCGLNPPASMNPSVPPPPFAAKRPVLKLPRRSAAEPTASIEAATAARWRIADELDEIRRREANLHDYETRLRALQSKFDSQPPPPTTTPATDEALALAWNRFYRARELLDVEQKQLREDRLAHRDAELALKQRAARLDEREAALAEREQRMEAELGRRQSRKVGAVVRRLTRAPFSAAKTMFKSA